MKQYLKSFLKDQNGAITVDWVVLTAAIIGLAVSGMLATQQGVDALSGKIKSGVADETVK